MYITEPPLAGNEKVLGVTVTLRSFSEEEGLLNGFAVPPPPPEDAVEAAGAGVEVVVVVVVVVVVLAEAGRQSVRTSQFVQSKLIA